MAGIPLRKSAYLSSEGGAPADIDMPGQSHPELQDKPSAWSNEFKAPDYGGLPELPRDVQEAMKDPQYQENLARLNAQAEEQLAQEEPEQEEPEEVEEAPAPKRKEDNFRNLRLAREKAERERDEAIAILKYQMQQQQPKAPEPEEDYGIGNDDLAEGKHIRKISKELADIKRQLASYKVQSQQEIQEAKIRVAFPDFDKVVSTENVEYLKEEHPEIAQMLINTEDHYTKAASAYKVIKEFGIYKEPVMSRDKLKALKNVAKPKPMAAINPQQGDTPLSKANAFAEGTLTEEIKAQLRKEMIQAQRGM